MSRKNKVLVILSSLMVLTLVISNLAAVKIWNLFGIPVDGGLIIFPLSYVLGDAAVEIYGKKTARFLIYLVTALNILSVLVFTAVIALPAFPGWNGQEAFAATLGSSARITIASLTGFVASSLSNNWLFVRMKVQQIHDSRHYSPVELAAGLHKEKDLLPETLDKYDKGYRLRSIASSLLGRLLDNLLFETIAFLGVLPLSDFLKQAVAAYFEGMIVEAFLVFTISEPIIIAIKGYIRAEPSV